MKHDDVSTHLNHLGRMYSKSYCGVINNKMIAILIFIENNQMIAILIFIENNQQTSDQAGLKM